MKLTKIIVVVVILLTIVLLISTNCKTKENKYYDPCTSDRNLNKQCNNDSDCEKYGGWCNESCSPKSCFKKKKSGWPCWRDKQCECVCDSGYCVKPRTKSKDEDCMDHCVCKSNKCTMKSGFLGFISEVTCD